MTQSWPQYRELINLILRMTPAGRSDLAEYVWTDGVLANPETARSAFRTRQPRPFFSMVDRFDTSSAKGGALFQAMVYGYLSADSPYLAVESHAVNTGSSRAGAIGDVDGYDGEFVVLAAEAKDKDLTAADEDDLIAFIEDVASSPDIDAVVFARTLDEEITATLDAAGIRGFSRVDMLRTIKIWDAAKQMAAIRAMRYYLVRIQKDPRLLTKVDEFLGTVITD